MIFRHPQMSRSTRFVAFERFLLPGVFCNGASFPLLCFWQVADIRRRVCQFGCTAFLPTIITSPPEVYAACIPQLQPAQGGATGAHTLGIHLEGPFIAAKMAGAHPLGWVRTPDLGIATMTETYVSWAGVRLITLAPELPGALLSIRTLTSKQSPTGHAIVVSSGHSNATVAEAVEAVTAGCTLVTHLFNAMKGFHHRDPGLIGLLGAPDLVRRKTFYSIIADGIHCHSSSIRIAFTAHPAGFVLISDAMSAMGLGDGTFMVRFVVLVVALLR